MDAIVNPNTSPATIVLDNKSGYSYCEKGLTDKDAAFITSQAELADSHRNIIAANRETVDGTRHLVDQVGRNAVEIKNADLSNATRFLILEKELCNIRESLGTAIERNGRSTELAVEKTAAATQLSLCSGFKDTALAVQTTAAAGLLEATKNAAAAALAAATNAAAAALTACTNTAAIQAAIAECCCEQKELIKSEANATRDLINSLNTQTLQRELSDAKSQIQTDAILAKLGKDK